MRKFQILDSFKGYVNKKDITNISPEYLVSPSKNTFINDGEKISSRPGFELFGAANTAATPIEYSWTWNTSTGTEIPLRAYDDELEFYYDGAWRKLKDGWTSVVFQSATWWSATEKLDLLVFVNGTANLFSWSGGITTFASCTSNTITKEGTTTWGEERFLVNGTRKVVIGGIEYTYTGGEGTTTLTGVTPDPTGGGYSAGDVIHQAVITTANKPAAGFYNDVIGLLDNQIYVGDSTKRQIYISKNTDYADFAYSSPRVPGEGALLTPDSPPFAFVPLEEKMYASCGKDEWYKISFKLSADLTKETVEIEQLKTAPLQAAISANATSRIKNDIVFVSNEPSIDTIGRVENKEDFSSVPLSDPIKLDMDSYIFNSGASVIYFKNQIFIAIPSSGVVLIYDIERKFWQPPWYMAINNFSIYNGTLLGHSSQVAESYTLLTGNNDNGNPIEAIAAFSYRNFGDRANLKSFNEYYTEGYISTGTTLTMTLKYDFGGYTSIVSNDIKGSNSSIIFQTIADNSLGKNPFGSNPLGSIVDSPSDLPKFRIKHGLQKQDFFEYQAQYSSNNVDMQWELLAHGPNVYVSPNRDNDLTQ